MNIDIGAKILSAEFSLNPSSSYDETPIAVITGFGSLEAGQQRRLYPDYGV